MLLLLLQRLQTSSAYIPAMQQLLPALPLLHALVLQAAAAAPPAAAAATAATAAHAAAATADNDEDEEEVCVAPEAAPAAAAAAAAAGGRACCCFLLQLRCLWRCAVEAANDTLRPLSLQQHHQKVNPKP